MTKSIHLLTTLSFLFIICTSAHAQQNATISGKVTAAEKPVEAASLSLLKTKDSSLVKIEISDKEGKFVPEMLILENDYSLHILNYNSPGATGALPVGAKIVSELLEKGYLNKSSGKGQSLWDINEILQ